MVDVVEHARLRRGGGMDAVGLEHGAIAGEALHQERNEFHILLSRNFGEQTLEPARVNRAVIGWNAHSGNHHARAGLAAGLDDGDQIFAGFLERIAAQAVIGAQFDDDDGGMMLRERGGQAGQAAECGIAADAGVDDLVIELVALQPLLEQRDPAFALCQSIPGGKAIAEHKDRLGGERRIYNQQHNKEKQAHG